jgi:dipeptidyl aminopeptidase/acylaminoacyl peptidase
VGRQAAFVRNGDIFLRDLANGRLTQVTRTPQPEASPQFSADGRLLSFRIDHDWSVYDVRTGVATPAAILKLEKDPDEAPKPDDLRDLQLRVFSTLKKQHDDKALLRQHADAFQKNDVTRSALPFYLGEDISIVETVLSPDARWLVVVTEPKTAAVGFEGKLTRYVTESGYEEFDKERVRVGRNPPAPQSLLLLNLTDHTAHELAIDSLPGMHDDPLKAIREENGLHDSQSAAAEPKVRAVLIKPKDPDGSAGGIRWSRDSRNLAIQLRSIDNKDRWIAAVDLDRYALVPQHRLTDPAWIGWRFNEFGWMNDSRTLWYESEESGFGHLYTKLPGGEPRALTQGRFEMADPELSADGRWFYLLGNAQAPYAYDVYRVPSGGGPLNRVTHLEGVENFLLTRDGKRLLVAHSSSYIPSQIAVANTDGSGTARDFTDTRTPEYRSMTWLTPEIVQVPSTHMNGVVYAKVYRAGGAGASAAAGAGAGADASDGAARRPAVVFVHGAGYTQDVHLKFPYYFREQMFNNLLVRQGYVVIDLDYRASSGYGREWRTAIYRQMGHPELEDLLDGKQWLVDHASADPKRTAIYGGSYGGFMTLMALFRAPGEFAAGAALRPVTDWMQYEHEYTSDILNDPQVDPIAYARSSPLEFAAGLKDALLICHGVVDDNVLFEDSMRLYQRLIELHKDNFTISPYPLDAHGFINADSWIDEYKRIDRLFEGALAQ